MDNNPELSRLVTEEDDIDESPSGGSSTRRVSSAPGGSRFSATARSSTQRVGAGRGGSSASGIGGGRGGLSTPEGGGPSLLQGSGGVSSTRGAGAGVVTWSPTSTGVGTGLSTTVGDVGGGGPSLLGATSGDGTSLLGASGGLGPSLYGPVGGYGSPSLYRPVGGGGSPLLLPVGAVGSPLLAYTWGGVPYQPPPAVAYWSRFPRIVPYTLRRTQPTRDQLTPIQMMQQDLGIRRDFTSKIQEYFKIIKKLTQIRELMLTCQKRLNQTVHNATLHQREKKTMDELKVHEHRCFLFKLTWYDDLEWWERSIINMSMTDAEMIALNGCIERLRSSSTDDSS